MYNKGLFKSWVPKPVMLLLTILFLCPIAVVNGVYASNSADIAGAFASYAEFVAMANNATVIGAGVAFAIAFRVKMRFRSKEIMVFCTVMMALLSCMCATSNNAVFLIVASLLIGVFKMFSMVELILFLSAIISPTGDKGKFYPIFYPLNVCIAQSLSYVFANLVFAHNWQAPYYIIAICMLSVAALSLIFQHDQRFCFKKPLYQIDWLSMMLFAASMTCLNYGLNFMRQQAWFISPYIVGSLITSILLFAALVYRQKFLKRKYLNFKIFISKSNLKHSIVLLFFLGIFLAAAGIFGQYAGGVLGYNNLIVSRLNNLGIIPGFIAGGIIAFFVFKHKWPLKYLIAGGFVAFFIHTLMLYLLIQPRMNIEQLYLPMSFKGLGMSMLFIGIWYYGTLGLGIDDLLGVIGVLLIIRTFVSTAFSSAIISWATYQGQWQSLSDMSAYWDTILIPNGMQIYGTAQINAVLASSKIVLGSLCWMIIPILIFVLTHHYGVVNPRKAILLRRLIRGNSIKGYRYSVR